MQKKNPKNAQRGERESPLSVARAISNTFSSLLVNEFVTIFEEMTNPPTRREDLLSVAEGQRQILVACAVDLNYSSTKLRHIIKNAI
ncbi:hypothetical protein B0O99DRAFT_624294 [Bisporella sp. PMI_857]|nr:hypothetical protein B0O99DRAFT_624294 [Bisporella sp. PMI_857]